MFNIYVLHVTLFMLQKLLSNMSFFFYTDIFKSQSSPSGES